MRPNARPSWIAAAIALGLVATASTATPDDRIKELQTKYVATQKAKADRAYHFGSQGAGGSSRTTAATVTAWCRFMSSGGRPTWGR